jgi:hypothetical protein
LLQILENEKWTNKYGGQAYAMLCKNKIFDFLEHKQREKSIYIWFNQKQAYISIKKGNREAAVECIKEISLKFSDEENTEEVSLSRCLKI